MKKSILVIAISVSILLAYWIDANMLSEEQMQDLHNLKSVPPNNFFIVNYNKILTTPEVQLAARDLIIQHPQYDTLIINPFVDTKKINSIYSVIGDSTQISKFTLTFHFYGRKKVFTPTVTCYYDSLNKNRTHLEDCTIVN